MSAITHTTEQQLALGTKVAAIAIDTLRVIVAAAIAWSFSAWWSIALAFVISYLASLAACWATATVVDLFCDTDASLTPALTALGSAAYSVSSTVSGWFTRATKAIA